MRVEFVKLILNVFKLLEGNKLFVDINEVYLLFYDGIKCCVSVGIINGCGEGIFDFNLLIICEEVFIMIDKVL